MNKTFNTGISNTFGCTVEKVVTWIFLENLRKHFLWILKSQYIHLRGNCRNRFWAILQISTANTQVMLSVTPPIKWFSNSIYMNGSWCGCPCRESLNVYALKPLYVSWAISDTIGVVFSVRFWCFLYNVTITTHQKGRCLRSDKQSPRHNVAGTSMLEM